MKLTTKYLRAGKLLPLFAASIAASLVSSGALVCEDTSAADLAELKASIADLTSAVGALKAKAAENATDAAIAAALLAKEAELQNAKDKAELLELKASNAELKKADLQRREADAKAAVDAAVKRGAIAAKDEATQKQWTALICADPANASLLAGIGASPALGGRITPPAALQASHAGSGIAVVQNSAKDCLQAYSALVAKNAAIKNVHDPEKRKLAAEAGALFASELRDRENDWAGMPLELALVSADVTSAAVGTLAGVLVLQRQLPLLAYDYPMLKTLFTDFSDAVGGWQQTEITRIPISPAVNEYDGTLVNGRPKGWLEVVPAQTVDVPITLSKHVGIPMIFGVQTLASTVRNLFAEQSAGAINALGGYFVDMATALMTAANFNAYAQITDASCGTTSGSTAITLATTAGVYPGQEISGTGIPTGTHIASVTDGTNAVMTIAATATATVTATLGGGKVPNLYATYAKAIADFNFASLGDIGAAFDTNKVPSANRAVMLNSAYYQRLAQDPSFNTFFAAMNNPEIITRGALPQVNNFIPQKAPFFPTSSNRVGFANHPAAIALKSRLPQDFAKAVSAMVPGNVTTVTDPSTGLSVLNVERVDLQGSYAESRIEAMLGAAVGDRRAGLVITSQ